jgi:hypothetical protein
MLDFFSMPRKEVQKHSKCFEKKMYPVDILIVLDKEIVVNVKTPQVS